MTKWTTADIPDQTGRTAVVTGANTGLGYETAAALAAKGAHVVLAVRNIEKGKEAARRIEQVTPGRTDPAARARPDVAGLHPLGRRRASLRSRIHRPVDQQRGRDDDAEVDHQGRLRIAVRHQPSGPLRADQPAARPRTGRAGFTHRDGQQQSAIASSAASASTICSGSVTTTGFVHTGSPSWPTCCSPTNSSGACKARTPLPSPHTRAARTPS